EPAFDVRRLRHEYLRSRAAVTQQIGLGFERDRRPADRAARIPTRQVPVRELVDRRDVLLRTLTNRVLEGLRDAVAVAEEVLIGMEHYDIHAHERMTAEHEDRRCRLGNLRHLDERRRLPVNRLRTLRDQEEHHGGQRRYDRPGIDARHAATLYLPLSSSKSSRPNANAPLGGSSLGGSSLLVPDHVDDARPGFAVTTAQSAAAARVYLVLHAVTAIRSRVLVDGAGRSLGLAPVVPARDSSQLTFDVWQQPLCHGEPRV